MRVCLTMGLLLVTLIVAEPLTAQPKDEKEKPSGEAAPPMSRVLLKNLQLEVRAAEFAAPIKFSEFLEAAGEHLKRAKRDVTFTVDEEAFREEANDLVVYDAEIRFKNLPSKTTFHHLLRQALKQLPVKSAMVVRAGRVDIVPLSRTSKEVMLNQTFHVDFSDKRLVAALEELSELTGVSIVVDPRVKQKVHTAVTARFHDDVALQDAVRMLTEMAELKMVYLVTGLYITTPEHAAAMQKELKQLYEGPAPAPAGGAIGGGGPGPGIGMPSIAPYLYAPGESPLAPPLPPSKSRRPEAG
jgi:hypothetical protein